MRKGKRKERSKWNTDKGRVSKWTRKKVRFEKGEYTAGAGRMG